jgi:hypothetical protein
MDATLPTPQSIALRREGWIFLGTSVVLTGALGAAMASKEHRVVGALTGIATGLIIPLGLSLLVLAPSARKAA